MKCDENLGNPDNDKIHDWRGNNSNPKGAVEFSNDLCEKYVYFCICFRDN